MSAKHTPGPWAYKEESGFDYGSKAYGVSAPAPHHWVIPPLNINPADTRLIAAAPDLLEALHAMLSHTAMLDPSQGFDGFDHSAVNQARAAIAKAEGKA